MRLEPPTALWGHSSCMNTAADFNLADVQVWVSGPKCPLFVLGAVYLHPHTFGKINTCTFRKETAATLLQADSHHGKKKKGIPVGQFMRIKRNYSKPKK